MVPVHAKHVAAGAFVIDKDDVGLSTDVWSLPDLQEWGAFAHGNDLSGSNDRWLPSDVQTQLLRSPALANAARLFRARWIKLKFRVTGDTYGIVRVYLLPDDVHRGTVDRSVGTLRRARRILLSSLDFSKTTWEGQSIQTNGNQKNGPHPLGYDISGADSSLLELFNNIPSPYPSPDDVVDVVSRDAMFNLLDGKVFGLTTELYAYQKKSAALMLQKEAQPGRVLDPRLQLVRGQDGESWYFDSVSGSLFLEPRHYDGISGGVLAEEMGSGKTIICLALILATRGTPANVPELYGTAPSPARKKVGSLLDMTASCITRNAVPWRPYLDAYGSQGWGYSQCISAIARNPGYYYIPAPELRRVGRHPSQANQRPPEKVYLSSATLVIVPNNLVAQWRQEIQKHTSGMDVIVITKKDEIPPHRSLIDCDIILFSQSRFEMLVTQTEDFSTVPLARLHFKRCIIDEGHKLGNSRIGKRSNLLIGLDQLRFDSRWVVTGTPSHGLFGVESRKSNENGALELPGGSVARESPGVDVYRSSSEMEKKDLERIGSMASLFLKARPWANTVLETGDTPADWDTYLMLPRHKKGSHGRWDSLKTTLDSLIIRHQLKEIGSLLPPVNERVVVLEGSYQDRLSMNIFSMMIIFNSVQSQRTDMDYFFHPRQRRSLLQIVHNLKQSTFFGGSFFAASEIAKSVETAEEFLKTKSVPINEEDEALLRQAIDLGHTAVGNSMRNISNQFHEMPVWVENFPGGAGHAWSLGDAKESKGPICTSASLLLALQRLVYNTAGEPEKFNALLNGGFVVEGKLEQEKLLNDQSAQASSAPRAAQSQTLAGNTKLGGDSPHKSRSHGVNGAKPVERIGADAFPEALDETTITATVSAKMSYMLDQIVKYQDDEKIIVFYENENIAWYLASMLDVLQIQHLIYAKGLSTERRAQYVNSFHHNPKFRVLLMDLSQAAFGLDMREASRIYFINPVLNPQVEAQAIGRARRVSQKKPVSVETLVLKGSIDEVILERKEHMTQAEHRQVKSILDIRPIFNWIKNASIEPLATCRAEDSAVRQMARLDAAYHVFGRGFGKTLHPDDGLVLDSPTRGRERVHDAGGRSSSSPAAEGSMKRSYQDGPGSPKAPPPGRAADSGEQRVAERPARRVRFAAG